MVFLICNIEEKKLISAWSSGPILDSETSHVIDMSMILLTDRLGIRLKTPTVVMILPHKIAIIPLEPPFRALHCKNVNTKLFEIIGNPLSGVEHPYLLILHALHTFDTRYPEQYVALAVNVGEENITLNKGMTLCFVQETDLTVKTLHMKEMDIVNIVEDKDIKSIKREKLLNCVQETSLKNDGKDCHGNTDKLAPILENSAFMFHKGFYPKPRITPLDAELFPTIQQQLEALLKEFSDIMSKNSSDIGLTHLTEMVLHTEPGSITVVNKPYSLPLKHHKFIKEVLTNLLEAGLIEWPLSPYAAPIMVVLCKVPTGSSLTETKRLVIDYPEINKQLPKVQMVQAKAKGTIALIEMAKIDYIGQR